MNSEDHHADRAEERWKAKSVALRVLFYVTGTYLFLTAVGILGAQAQK
ncbi:DUF6126 family protein [Streptomyces sp. NPDC054861]